MDEIRATLAQLMGKFEEPEDVEETKSFLDSDVCRMFLTGICPHDLFENTKHYLGECKRLHSERLREKYMNERKSRYFGFEVDTLRTIQPMIDDCDKRISKGKARAEDDGGRKPTIDPLVLNEAKRIDDQIQAKMTLADELGMNGDVEQSFKIVEEVELLKKTKLEMLEKAGEASYQQRLKPCDICGALLSATDSDRRLTEHYSGKIHIGFQKLRDMAKTLTAYINENRPQRTSARTEATSDPKEKEEVASAPANETRHHSNKDRRSRSYNRHDRRHDHSRNRKSCRRRSRSRSRTPPRHRDRDRDRSRSRDRSRDRSRNRDRRHR
ncbi:hypothetical protein BEWA_022710 [Theileria equi strain WA]|uniref:Uncharacterized protein n=1 Tax=Theileria equi strain WA TaxID=1537102 RepID=L0AW24_THEEQ|nr:hypothetical protein BEWA_022710 [Theileria equi strain WA]AFZ79423.1 hypothetical protein BEWA_022710 [Theileria equi strain WA]|eukprot:XP_004829089.1 hypothetical protein BEWA_022710 [Theileria equi strain WA]